MYNTKTKKKAWCPTGPSWTKITPDVKLLFKVPTEYDYDNEDIVFYAHKAILASRSPVFEQIFKTHLKEKDNTQVIIENQINISGSFDFVLEYMYTSSIRQMATYDDHYPIIYAAEKYEVNSLLQWYAHYVYKQELNIYNAMPCLLAAILTKQTVIIRYVVLFIQEQSFRINKLRSSTMYGIDEIFKRKDVLEHLFYYGWGSASCCKKDNVWTPTLFLNAEKYYKSEDFSDITIYIGETSIRAHKAILALKSKVFEELLAEKYPDKKDCKLVIEDVDEKSFQLFLEFLYSNKLPYCQIDMNLFSVASKYQLHSLVEICQLKFIDELRVDNALEYFQKSLVYQCPILRKYAKKFASVKHLRDDCKSYEHMDFDILTKAVSALMEPPQLLDYKRFHLNQAMFPCTSETLLNDLHSYASQKNMKLDIQVFIYRMEKWERGNFQTKLEFFLRPGECIHHPNELGSVHANDFGIILITGSKN